MSLRLVLASALLLAAAGSAAAFPSPAIVIPVHPPAHDAIDINDCMATMDDATEAVCIYIDCEDGIVIALFKDCEC